MKIYMMRYTPDDEESRIVAFSSKRKRVERLSWETRKNDYSCAHDSEFAFWEIDMKPTKSNMIDMFNKPWACRV